MLLFIFQHKLVKPALVCLVCCQILSQDQRDRFYPQKGLYSQQNGDSIGELIALSTSFLDLVYLISLANHLVISHFYSVQVYTLSDQYFRVLSLDCLWKFFLFFQVFLIQHTFSWNNHASSVDYSITVMLKPLPAWF